MSEAKPPSPVHPAPGAAVPKAPPQAAAETRRQAPRVAQDKEPSARDETARNEEREREASRLLRVEHDAQQQALAARQAQAEAADQEVARVAREQQALAARQEHAEIADREATRVAREQQARDETTRNEEREREREAIRMLRASAGQQQALHGSGSPQVIAPQGVASQHQGDERPVMNLSLLYGHLQALGRPRTPFNEAAIALELQALVDGVREAVRRKAPDAAEMACLILASPHIAITRKE